MWKFTALALCATFTVGVVSSAQGSSEVRGGAPVQAQGDDASYAHTPGELMPYHSVRAPYRRLYLSPPRLYGVSRGAADLAGVPSVKIGLLAPLEGSSDATAGSALLAGVQLALDAQNERGGLEGVPFELVVRNDLALWGSSANTLVDLAYREKVWAVIGSVDSNSTHVALRVALKCEIPIVNVGATDPTITETGIPWIVRCTPDDRQLGYSLAEMLFAGQSPMRVAVIRSSDRYGRMGVKEFRDAARRLGSPLPMEILFRPGARSFDSELARIEHSKAEGVVIWAHGEDAGRIVRRMRELGMEQQVFGTDRLVSPDFLRAAGDAAEGVTALAWTDPDRGGAAWTAFEAQFQKRFGRTPDAFAAYGFDAMNFVAESLRSAGLDRVKLRDALLLRRRRSGVTGTMQFDVTSNNLADLVTYRVEGGRFVRR